MSLAEAGAPASHTIWSLRGRAYCPLGPADQLPHRELWDGGWIGWLGDEMNGFRFVNNLSGKGLLGDPGRVFAKRYILHFRKEIFEARRGGEAVRQASGE